MKGMTPSSLGFCYVRRQHAQQPCKRRWHGEPRIPPKVHQKSENDIEANGIGQHHETVMDWSSPIKVFPKLTLVTRSKERARQARDRSVPVAGLLAKYDLPRPSVRFR